jgi:hypothetical protein
LREGTLAPERRASFKPIAIACLRLFTFLRERPDFSLPRFISCIARSTFLPAFGPYFRVDFFRAAMLNPCSPASEQIDHYENQHDDQNQVDEAAAEVHQESDQPDDEENHDDRPQNP